MIGLAIELETVATMHQNLVGGKRFIGSYRPDTDRFDDNGTGGGDFQLAPPWVEAPQDFIPFDESGTFPLPVAPSADTTVLEMAVPKGYDGVIKAYNLNFAGGGFVSGSGTIVWRITVDGNAVRNFSNILSEKGTIEIPRDLRGGLRVFSGQVVRAIVNHASDNTLTGDVICGFQGWFYPSKGN